LGRTVPPPKTFSVERSWRGTEDIKRNPVNSDNPVDPV
jgi:hypothetical protein